MLGIGSGRGDIGLLVVPVERGSRSCATASCWALLLRRAGRRRSWDIAHPSVKLGTSTRAMKRLTSRLRSAAFYANGSGNPRQ
jgi:hypothetical protein